jgi:hypothetical protein
MMPQDYPLTLYRGDTFGPLVVHVWTNTAHTVPAVLTGVVAAAEIRDKPGGTTIVPMDCVVDPAGTITVGLSADDSADAPLKKGVWDLELTYLDGTVVTALRGTVEVTTDVTHSTATVTTLGQLQLRTA